MKRLLTGLLALLAAVCSINPANLSRDNPAKIAPITRQVQQGPFYAEELTQANRFFDAFPGKIKGIREIRKYRTPGARKCLVHILDNHFGFNKDLWMIKYIQDSNERELLMKHVRDCYDGVNAVQKDIFLALIDLKNKGLIKNARSEGFSDRHSVEEVKRFYDNMLNAVLFTGCYEEDFALGNHEAYRYIPGAPVILATGKDLDILPGIKKSRPPGLTDIYWKFDGREDSALEVVAESNEPYSVLIFGGAHAFGGKQSCGANYNDDARVSFKDNLQRRKWSLIELIPEHYLLK